MYPAGRIAADELKNYEDVGVEIGVIPLQ